MNRVYKVDIHVYNTLKKRSRSKLVDTITYTIIARDKDNAGGKAMDKAWEEKRENPEKFKGCVFGYTVSQIKPITEV